MVSDSPTDGGAAGRGIYSPVPKVHLEEPFQHPARVAGGRSPATLSSSIRGNLETPRARMREGVRSIPERKQRAPGTPELSAVYFERFLSPR